MAQSFNQNISQWNVHRVKYFSEMVRWICSGMHGTFPMTFSPLRFDFSPSCLFKKFLKTRNFNSDISGWNTSSAIDMRQMVCNPALKLVCLY